MALEPVAAVDQIYEDDPKCTTTGYIYFQIAVRAETAYKNLIAEEDWSDQERQGAIFPCLNLPILLKTIKLQLLIRMAITKKN